MIDWFLVIAFSLMILGIAGSLFPSIPGPILSIIGASIYFWSTGYTTPRPIIFGLIILTGLFAVFLDYLASYYGAEKAEASKKTAIAAALASFLLFFVTGPLGIILGTGLVVLLREIMLGKELEEAFDAAIYTTIALLGSVVVKVCLTTVILVIFLLSLLI